jgi:alkylated DNA repair protein (DNA oxidative demethylase)
LAELLETADLFGAADDWRRMEFAPGATLLRGFAVDIAPALLRTTEEIAAHAAFRHMITPGGYRMSVAMTCCGAVGWVSEPSGYRYAPIDPSSGKPWPQLPALFLDLAGHAAASAGFAGYRPDCCLINRYEAGARLSLHQDRDEEDPLSPIVSVSLGLPAQFLFGGLRRAARTQRISLAHGDVVVWGGPSRFAYHGVAPLADGEHPATGRTRINLTFRRARA